MSKEALLEKLTELGKQRGIDRDVVRTVIDMFREYTGFLDETLSPHLVGLSSNGQILTQITNDFNGLTVSIDTIKSQVSDELHIMRNDIDGLSASYKDLAAQFNKDSFIKNMNTLKSDMDRLGKSLVDLENRLDKLEAAKSST